MDPLVWIEQKFGVDLKARSPIELPNCGRDYLARMFHIFDYTRGVEVGVERGLYSEVLCRENPGVHLFCVDAWTAYRGYRDHVDSEKLQRFYEETQERLAPFPNARLVRQFSVDAAKTFADGSLDFVYLDGNHSFENVAADLAAWTPKVRYGGIIAGHDYVRYYLPNQIHVIPAVNGWTDAYEIKPWFLLGTQAKVEGQIRDTARSFFWVKAPWPDHRKSKKPVKQ